MPELPEVEVVRRGLDTHLRGRRLGGVEVLHPRAVRSHVGTDIVDMLDATLITSIARRGKFMWFHLAPCVPDVLDVADGERGGFSTPEPEPLALVVHLGMSGQMLIGHPGEVTSPHVRIRCRATRSTRAVPLVPSHGDVDEDVELSFVDQRTFGRWEVVPLVDDPHGHLPGIPASIQHIAPDPFEAGFQPEAVARAVSRRKSPIKTVLLNQEIVSGIGNIYADEALWRAGVRPTVAARRLSQVKIRAILSAARDVMEEALGAGGTSFDALYVNVNGASGYFDRSLHAYGRNGLPCLRCGETMHSTVIGGRSSTWCHVCQR